MFDVLVSLFLGKFPDEGITIFITYFYNHCLIWYWGFCMIPAILINNEIILILTKESDYNIFFITTTQSTRQFTWQFTWQTIIFVSLVPTHKTWVINNEVLLSRLDKLADLFTIRVFVACYYIEHLYEWGCQYWVASVIEGTISSTLHTGIVIISQRRIILFCQQLCKLVGVINLRIFNKSYRWSVNLIFIYTLSYKLL